MSFVSIILCDDYTSVIAESRGSKYIKMVDFIRVFAEMLIIKGGLQPLNS